MVRLYPVDTPTRRPQAATPPAAAQPTPDAPFGAILRGHRVSRGMTQEELAAASGMSVRAIRNLEIGRTRQPHPRSARLLSTALGLTEEARAELLRAVRREAPARTAVAAPLRPLTGFPGRCELPADVPDLVGREEAVARLMRALTDRSVPTMARLGVVTGGPGSGRTAVLVHVAHRLRRTFPDGQIHADLRGLPAGPDRPAAVLNRVLRSLGLTALPETMDERAAMLRAVLAARRVLLVLDNVDGEAEVRPLLTGSATSAVLVVSRRPLLALRAAVTVRLGPLPERAAVHLLASVVGDGRPAAEPTAAVAVARACSRLPLPLRIAGAWLVARPNRRVTDLARLLGEERTRLDHLTVGDLSVRASIADHLGGLTAGERHALRRIASLDDVYFGLGDLAGLPAAGDAVERLLHANVLSATADGRYCVDPLIRSTVADWGTPLAKVVSSIS